MATINIAYASTASLTHTLASLATGSARESTAIDNTSTLYTDVMLYYAIKLATGTPASNLCINFYVYASVDGSNYTDNATGADAALTMRSPTNLILIKPENTPTSGALVYKYTFLSIAAAFGGNLPPKWGIVVENNTNLAFDSTEGNHTKSYRGVTWTVT